MVLQLLFCKAETTITRRKDQWFSTHRAYKGKGLKKTKKQKTKAIQNPEYLQKVDKEFMNNIQYYYWLNTDDMTKKFIVRFSKYIRAAAIVSIVLKIHPPTSLSQC